MLKTTIMTKLTMSADIKKTKNNTNQRNIKYKSNLNNDNDNSIDSSKNKSNNKTCLHSWDSIVKNLNGFLTRKAINHINV